MQDRKSYGKDQNYINDVIVEPIPLEAIYQKKPYSASQVQL